MKQEPRREHRHLIRFTHNIGFNKQYTTIAVYALIVLAFAVVCVFFLLNRDSYTSVFDTVKGIVSPIFIGMLIAYILNPFLNLFEHAIFISKPKRTLRKARRELFRAKLNFDHVRSRTAPAKTETEAAIKRLAEARTALADAYAGVEKEAADKEARYAKRAAKKKVRPSFFPRPKKDRSHPMRGISLICTYVLFLAVISLILWIVIPQCISSLLRLIRNLESYVRAIPVRLQDLLNQSDTLRGLYDLINAQIDLREWITGFVEDASGTLSGLLSSLPNYAVSLFSSLTSGITNLVLGIFLSIYFLSSKEMLSRQIKRLGRAFLPSRAYHHVRHVIVEIDHKFGKFIEGKILDSTIIGLLALIAMMIMGMPYYQMLALVIGITNMIPFFGPVFGAVIGGFIILISEPAKLIPFLIMVLILQQLDGNVIGPQILGDSLGLAPIWIMIAIVIMSGLLGFFGMLFGVPLFAVLYTLVREAIDRRLKKRKQFAAPPNVNEVPDQAADTCQTNPEENA